MIKQAKRFCTLFVLCWIVVLSVSAIDFTGVRQLVARRFPMLTNKVAFAPLLHSDKEAFVLTMQKGRLLIRANSTSAAAMALNHYLNTYCHVSLSHNADNLPPTFQLVPIKGEVRMETPFKYRYALNYCTYNYTYSFYNWSDFERELDWMALNGINLMLAPMGMEKVWMETLTQLGFSKTEAQRFIPGPGYTAWWLMGNLEGWGGPMSEALIEARYQLQRKMLQRMQVLGIQPVVQGFPGLVPSFFKERFPTAQLVLQGRWGHFNRPPMLLPSDKDLFQQVAKAYYESLIRCYGRDFKFLGGDLFHEGGNTKGVDVAATAAAVQQTMLRYFPSAKWVLQGWNNNPSPTLLSKLDKQHVLLINLSGEIAASWESSNEFGGTPWLWGSVNHFGGKTDMGGQLPVLVAEPHRAFSQTKDGVMQGIGILPEGINSNPVVYDLALKTAWYTTTPDLDRLLRDYIAYRYGHVDESLVQAWHILSHSVYGEFKIKGEGTFESIFCARPGLHVTSVSTWGPKQMQYNPKDLEKALGLFRRVADQYKGSATYQYDLVDLARQVMANHARDVYAAAMQAYRNKDAVLLHEKGEAFMRLLQLQDRLLQTDTHFLLGNWLAQAANYGVTAADKQQALHNAKMLITYWGPDSAATRVHDYANKEWAGLLKSYYEPRWQKFFHALYQSVNTGEMPHIDFFAMEKQWADSPQTAATTPTGNYLEQVDSVLKAVLLPYQNAALPSAIRVHDLLQRMTLDEKLAQMRHIHFKHYNTDGHVDLTKLRNNYTHGMSFGCFEAFPYSSTQYRQAVSTIQQNAADSTRFGIPVIPVIEGIHGIVQDGCTIFPQAIAQGATFNPQLVFRMAQHIGTEMRAIGARQVLAPDLDIAREQRWGRVEETFGEDPYLISRMGYNYVKGIQSRGGIPTLKHFVAHGTPQSGLNLASVKGGQRELFDVYVKPFEYVIRHTKAGSVMNCYSAYDNEAITSSHFFLRTLLRDSLHFKGYIYSDWGSIPMLRYFHHTADSEAEAAQQAINAGVDLEAGSDYYRTAPTLIAQGLLDKARIDSAAAHVLYTKFEAGLFDELASDTLHWRQQIHTPEAVTVAKQLADESLVLLENRNHFLPLDLNRLHSIAVVGPNAAQVQFGDYSWTADNRHGITPLAGIQQVAGMRTKVRYAKGCDYYSQNTDSIDEAVALAKQSDVTVVVVGTQSMLLARPSQPSTSGEGYDLSDLTLPGVQQQLIERIAATGKPFIVVMVTGRPLLTEAFKNKANALLVQWYGGEQAGLSLAQALFGQLNPSGRLPISFPKATGQLPVYYNHLPTDKGYYNKKGTPDKPGRDYVFADPYPAYPFGYGLSYTTFKYSQLALSKKQANENDTIAVTFWVQNTGKRAGKEVAQLYIRDMKSSVATPIKQLFGFEKCALQPGETKTITLQLPIADLYLHNAAMQRVVESGDFEVQIGASSADILLRDTLHVGAANMLKTSENKNDTHPQPMGKRISVQGVVRNVQAFLMAGVKVQAGKQTVFTDARGVYRITAHEGEQLRFSLKGYRTETLVLRKGGIFDVELSAETP